MAQLHLLSKLSCIKMVTTNPEPAAVPTIPAEYSMTKVQIPSIQELLGCHDILHYPYAQTFEEANDEPIFILHTSGSNRVSRNL